jgi:membrane associated rhomboid family serine protease
MAFPQNGPPSSTTGTHARSAVNVPERRGPGAALLLLLAPLLCCGGPLIIVGLASASAATLGAVGGVLGGVLMAALAITLWARRRRRVDAPCCPRERAFRG